MTAFRIDRSLVIRRGTRSYQLHRVFMNESGREQINFEDQCTGASLTMTPGHLMRRIQSGDIKLVSGSSAEVPFNAPDEAPGLVFSWDSLSEAQTRLLKFRIAMVKRTRRQGIRRGQRSAVERFLTSISSTLEVPEGQSFPSASSVMRWMKAWEESDGSPAALLPRHGFRITPSRLSEAQLDLAKKVLTDFYATQAHPSLAKTLEEVKTRALALRCDLKAPSLSTMQRLKQDMNRYELDAKRFGVAYARNKWRTSYEGFLTTRIQERYEIDHTLIDLVVVSDVNGLPLGRPTITVVVDTYSKMVVGLFISFWGTGVGTVISALKNAIFPKDDIVEICAAEMRWPCYGICELFALDNGLEFHARAFQALAFSIGSDLLYCPVRQPWFKASVERALGEMNIYLPPQGRVEKPLNNYVPISSEKTACVTFSALCIGLIKGLVHVRGTSPDDRSLRRPLEVWQESAARLPPPRLPTQMGGLDVLMTIGKTRVISGEGSVIDYIRYNSDELMSLRQKYGSRFSTEVRRNPEDLDYIWVQDPSTKGWLQVPSCRPEYTQGLSIVQHKALRQITKDHHRESGSIDALLRAKQDLREHWSTSVKVGKRLRAAHLKALGGMTSSTALFQPTDTVAKPKPTTGSAPQSKVVTEEEYGWYSNEDAFESITQAGGVL